MTTESITSPTNGTLRIVSLVPSWTETLVWAGVNVVGRTRFCIHPKRICLKIPVVGGTKEVDWRKVEALDPDLVVLDREENRKEILDKLPAPAHLTHVTSVKDVQTELIRLAETLENSKLFDLADQWQRVLPEKQSRARLQALPGVIQWIREPTPACHQLLYLIWKSPWMTLSRDTFVGSVLETLGYGTYLPAFDTLYPTISLDEFEPSRTLLLFPTEPYPFDQHLEIAEATGFPAAIVDGEKFSWFGLRTLLFLRKHFKV